VNVRLHNVTAQDVLPQRIPALYRDGTLRLVFRADLREATRLTAEIQGVSADGARTHRFTFDVRKAPALAEVERLWGHEKVAALLSEERLGEHDEERRDAIIAYATQYGVVTPYTSWVIARPPAHGTAASGAHEDAVADGLPSAMTPPASPPSGRSSRGGNVVPGDAGAADATADTGDGDEPRRRAQPLPALLALLALALAARLARRRR